MLLLLLTSTPTPIVAASGALTAALAPPLPARRSRLRRRPPHATSAGDYYGLTDDGDFAIFGVNAAAEDGAPAGEGGGGGAADGPPREGTAVGWEGVGRMLFDEPLLQSGRKDLGVGAGNAYRDFRGNEVVPKADPRVREWLAAALPALDAGDVGTYAEGLTALGFRPRCASARELTPEDLEFMKPLHRRYLYKQIMGEEHTDDP